ncbi:MULTISPECIES: helix-turn-helix transcriptional regulator [unclassified Enterococcus]|uniref:helix-turn-helix domain-containing protein n=1 Tax=unclassified Enterococcus TaxID=2608891 RepID=UPI001557D204|nr:MULTISPECIES: helix-turn-helix transcriptional regulator [unclassified Enterococcus]MBS7576497.1 helix-turn-helix transcriptional regulator [Enterococcus sp. MMGLQ5-2]MBS7583729.1 helix-turn-helix transcriptional regulator [Enterococcus sp. MMGLQ5-1]NPD11590.1 helix-turn-helix transcriptional regulator [Enterococcus sp. MMGLQ5-1]NPD36334.1 helix-turn-helix transcriptional regulator [Enterococcus sp. MMGLQ5-2]
MKFNLNRLKAERIAKKYSQQEIADKLNWSRSVYTKRENGSVPLGVDELADIVTVLEIPEDRISIFFSL